MRAEPDLAETQTALGYVKFFLDWDWPAAEEAFRRATTLDANSSSATRIVGVLLSHMGRHQEARPWLRRARELDPLYPMNHSLSAHVAFQARDYPSAIDFARHTTVVDPEFWIGYFHLAQAYEQTGKPELALEALTHAARLSGGNSKAIALRGYILAKQGRTGEAKEVLGMLETLSRERYVPPYAMALIHAGLGQREAALEWLERALQVRDVHLIFLPVDPKWDSYRVESRFEALLDRCGFTRGE